MGKEKKYNSILATRFREIRKENHLRQAELAEKLNCTDQYISDIENQRSEIKPNIANLMEHFFDVDSNYLLDENVKHKNQYDEMQTNWRRINRETILINHIVSSLAKLNGYTVETNQIPESGNVNEVLKKIKSYMVFKKNDNIEFSLSVSDVNILGNHLSDVFETIIKWHYKK